MVTEYSYAVSPRSTQAITNVAEAFLARLAPEHLETEGTLDLGELVDHSVERERIVVYPVEHSDLPEAEAETRAGAIADWIEIWMRREFYDALFTENSNTVRARSTLAHELGHAVLHQAEVLAGRHNPQILTMRRAPREQLKPYRDSEWQAYAFAGSLLAPVRVLRSMPTADPFRLAQVFGVSEPFMRSHMKRVTKLL
jgi:IrrE N-terminal-like domain